jgi:uncharacterized protein YfaS (alpha-2-macroglobulin family)
MKTQNLCFSFLLIIILILQSSSSHSQSKDVNFNISTNSIYFPGEDINMNMYSYDYGNKKDGRKSIAFEISVLKIKDIDAFYSKQSSRYNLDVLSKDSLNLLYLTEEVSSFKKTLSSKRDYGYLYINETIPIKVNSKGAYLIQVKSGNKVAYCGFIISDLGMVSKAGNNSMLAYVVDRRSGNPISNAQLSFYIGTNQIGAGKTMDGMFYQTVTDEVKVNTGSDEDSKPMIIGKHNDDIVLSDAYMFFGYNQNKYYTYIFTEQPVYRTGSEVNFKGTIRKNTSSGMEPLSNKELTVIIKDSKNSEVYKELVKTNSNGSFDGSYKIDENGALGDYYIYANIDENNSYSAPFTVEQYKKPEYKVTVTTDRNQYFGHDELKAEIDARYYFGSPVTEATVEFNIYKVRYYKPWWMFSEYSWWYSDYYENQDDNQKFNGAEFIYSGSGQLDSEGKLSIDYKINEDFKSEDRGYYDWYRPYYNNSDYKYIVQAKVTDKSRREISGNTTAFVTRGGFSLTAKTDKYIYKPSETVNITVNAFDFADKPVETEFEATVYKTNWNRDYSKEDKDLKQTIKGSTKIDGKGIVSYNIGSSDAEGSYLVEITSKDDRANIITTTANFYVSTGNMWWYYNQSGGVQIIPDKESYKVGEVCHALILITNPDANVLITTNTDDILSYKVQKFSGISSMIDIPITEKYNGGFEINVNYVFEGQFYNTSKNVLTIPEEKFLTVQIEPSQLIYKPKETGQLKVRVLDNYGSPVRNAEVSIGVVDESIYSIKEDNTKDIRKFFYGQRSTGVSTGYISNNNSYGQSRLITIYERFNLKSTNDKDLGTVKGSLLKEDGTPVQYAVIVINEDYMAALTDIDGNFEFRLPEGEYEIQVYSDSKSKDGTVEIEVNKGSIKVVNLKINDDNEIRGIEDIASTTSGVIKDEAGNEINIRGGRTNETAIIVDGVLTHSPMSEMKKSDNVQLVNPDVRSDFRDAIFWSPYTVTDGEGYAIVDVKYPDNLTTWRITSRVITEDTKVGQMVSTVITRKDLLIRMETPRFLQENDELVISTIVHNYLSTEKQTKVKFTGENVFLMDESNERTVSIAPNTDVRLDWKIRVIQPIGEAKLYSEALTDEESDAMEVKVPLQPKGLKITETAIADFSDQNKTETKILNIPTGTDLRSSEITIAVDPSLASTLLTSMDELIGYPYGCVEQTMSRFLPTVIVANTFKDLNIPVSDAMAKDLPLMVTKGLQRLYGFQNSNGGWGWWQNDDGNPFMTAYVVYGLNIARSAGYDVSDGVLKKGISSIKRQLKSTDTDATTTAYMIYVLAGINEKDKDYLGEEISKIRSSEINDYARSLIALSWKLIGDNSKAEETLSELIKNVKQTGEGAAYWEGLQFHYRWQNDKVQTTAMALKALVNIDSKSELKDKVVRWLLTQRQGTSWRNTQETAMIIYAMTDYLKTSNELNPDYTVRVTLNGDIVFEKRMTSADVYLKGVPVVIQNEKLKTGENEIRIEKSGSGKVYFSSTLNYYNSLNTISANEEGFRVEREYFKLEKYPSYIEDKITYKKNYFDGNVKSGDEILVKLRVHSKSEDYQYFMLEDPLPSGAEVIKDDWAFKIEGENNYEGYGYYYWRWWYADKDIRDDKVTFFATYIGKGVYEFSYIMQVQIPGEFNINPAQGMLMYYPEVNGNSENLVMKVTD